jgi:hypothetical protein
MVVLIAKVGGIPTTDLVAAVAFIVGTSARLLSLAQSILLDMVGKILKTNLAQDAIKNLEDKDGN